MGIIKPVTLTRKRKHSISPSEDRSSPEKNVEEGRKKSDVPPRPPNAFMLYRKDMSKVFGVVSILPIFQGLERKTSGHTLGEESRQIAALWRKEPDEVKQLYHQKAQLENEVHRARYPGYKYHPRKNPKGSGKISHSWRGKKRPEEQPPIAPEILELLPAEPREKEKEPEAKSPADTGITASRG